MLIRKAVTHNDIASCVDIGIQQLLFHKLFPYQKEFCLKALYEAARMGKFLRVIEEEGIIRAWIFADQGRPMHGDYQILFQRYCATDFVGRKAIEAIKELHLALIDEACRLKIPLIHSQGSPCDKRNTFARILEGEGWEREGFVAVYRTGYPLVAPVGTQGLRLGSWPYEGHGG